MCPLVKSVYPIQFAISIRECSTVMVHYEGKCILHASAYWEVLNSLNLFIVTFIVDYFFVLRRKLHHCRSCFLSFTIHESILISFGFSYYYVKYFL